MTSRSVSIVFLCSVMGASSPVFGRQDTASKLEHLEAQNRLLHEKHTLLEERFDNKTERLEITMMQKMIEEQKEQRELFYKILAALGIPFGLLTAYIFGSGQASLKNVKDEFKKDLGQAVTDFKKQLEAAESHFHDLAVSGEKRIENALTQKWEEKEKAFSKTTDALMVRGRDRATATVYNDLCDDFFNLCLNFSKEAVDEGWYVSLLNSFCDIAKKGLEVSRKNYKSTDLTERENGALIEYDIDMYAQSLKNYVSILLLRAQDYDMNNVQAVRTEVEFLAQRTCNQWNEIPKTNKGNAEIYAQYENRLHAINHIRSILQKSIAPNISSISNNMEGISPDLNR